MISETSDETHIVYWVDDVRRLIQGLFIWNGRVLLVSHNTSKLAIPFQD